MSLSSYYPLFQLLLLLTLLPRFSLSTSNYTHKFPGRNQADNSSCPLNLNSIRTALNDVPVRPQFRDLPRECQQHIFEGVLFLRAQYLQASGNFCPPADTFQACWASYRQLAFEFLNGFDIEVACGEHRDWVFGTCQDVETREEFERLLPVSELREMNLYCNQSLSNVSNCQSCTNKLSSIGSKFFSNASGCSSYLVFYAAGVINKFGPTDPGTSKCFFGLEYVVRSRGDKQLPLVYGVILGSAIGIAGSPVVIWTLWWLHKKRERRKINDLVRDESNISDVEVGLSSRNAPLVEFDIEDIRKATMNFSRENLIGKGGYGNVYKGVLPDGSDVAFKRFKNCSPSGDANFRHEVDMVASVRHVNLVTLRGYCMSLIPILGHQRIIVYDLMRNGSLHDHLFGTGMKRLSWPIRHKIALGTARGLAYLHNGVRPAIMHRDIKASNILLDESFEPKVADFGLAKFNSQGMTHMSTRVAGTLGYVSPEYALYGKLTEKSDVYSFGILLLVLLSGREAYENKEGTVSLLADWAWNLVKEGNALNVIEENISEVGFPEVMELYVYIAVTCAHPILDARPTMDQVVRILESELFGAHFSASSNGISSTVSSYMCSSSSSISGEHISENEYVEGSCTLEID